METFGQLCDQPLYRNIAQFARLHFMKAAAISTPFTYKNVDGDIVQRFPEQVLQLCGHPAEFKPALGIEHQIDVRRNGSGMVQYEAKWSS